MHYLAYFTGARLKIERADKHIGDLADVLAIFLKSDFYRLSVEKNAEGHDALTLESTTPLPSDVALILGDALHNLRSALDHVAYEVIANTGETPSRHVAFPIAKGRQELVDALRGGEIEAAAGAALVRVIVDTVRPYKGGNDALYALHALDIGDKHKLLIPVVSIVGVFGIHAVDSNHNVIQNINLAVTKSGKVNAIATSGTLEITDYGQPAVEVVFGEGQPFEAQPVLPTLHQLSQLVAGVVETIEQAYTAPQR